MTDMAATVTANGTVTVTVIGESLIDVVDVVDDTIGTVSRRPGGGPYNVAVGLARLGVSTQLLTSWADDADGRLLAAHATTSGVRPMVTPAPVTSTARATVDAAGQASYDFDLTWAVRVPPALAPTPVLHVGSLGAFLLPGVADVERLVSAWLGKAFISFDPNCRPSLTPDADETRRRVQSFVEQSDLVKASDEDIAWLYPGDPPAAVAARWLAAGPVLVVVTRGAAGAQAWTRHRDATVAAPAVPTGSTASEVVDTVGAGDAFMAGLLWGLPTPQRDEVAALADTQLIRLLSRAALVARRTCDRVGADPPWLRELPTSAAHGA